jgi:2-dehydropantoate 2-reductase
MATAEFAILGAGAIGSILGAHLARAGHSVVMLVREQRAAQIRARGLTLAGLADFSTAVPTITDSSSFEGAETLIVAMKTPGTSSALSALRHANIGVALSIQNGLWKNEALAQAFGADRVLGALADTSGELLSNGDVLFTRNVNLFIGEIRGEPQLSTRAVSIAHAIDASGVRSSAVANMLGREWTKFVGWVGLMLLAVTTRTVTWRYLSEPHAATILVRLTREVAQLTRALSIELVEEQALLPLEPILRGSETKAIEAVLATGQHYRTRAPEHRMSALQDLEAGRPLEVDETLGYAVRRAQALGLELPLLESAYHLVATIDRTRALC